MKIIELTKGKQTIVDDDMFEILNQYSWYASTGKKDNNFYAARCFRPPQKTVFLHHVVIGEPLKGLKLVIDHINKDTLDNRRENLRIVSSRMNGLNRKNSPRLFGTSKREKGQWAARIKYRGRDICLGVFEDREKAHLVYLEALKIVDPIAYAFALKTPEGRSE